MCLGTRTEDCPGHPRLENSFNSAQQAPNDALRAQLNELCELVTQLLKRIDDPQRAEQLKNDLESFTKEAAKPAPRRKLLEVTRDGLVEAANTVNELAGPIIALLAKILLAIP